MNITLSLDKTLYIYLPRKNEIEIDEQKKVFETIRVGSILDLKKVLDINLDFDSDGFVIGIEILT